MANAGTLLSDLDSKTPVIDPDGDLVQKIMIDMNQSKGRAASAQAPQNIIINPPEMHQQQQRVISDPNPNTYYPMAADPSPATAHMIGNSYPSPSDFANILQSQTAVRNNSNSFVISDGNVAAPQKKSFYLEILDQMRQPVLVALIFMVLSMPVVNILIGHYVPFFVRSSGDLFTSGLMAKALAAGALYWVVNHVLVPLASA